MIGHISRAVVVAFALLLVAAIPVLGHAELVESDPPEGGTIETPYTLTATFSEELLERSNIVVDNAAGDEVARGEPDPNDRTVMVVELPELPPGSYVANWTARTADGHTERAQIHFTVAAAATPSPTATASPTPTATETSGIPTASLQPTASPAAITPAPTASPIVGDGPPTAGANDALLAIVLAVIVIGAIALFLFARSRR